MGQQQSKEELLYQQVKKRNIKKIRALRREGVGLEWVDKQGYTPLIVACMDPKLITVAKTLIELGADVNASRTNSPSGTPIYGAALKGLDQTVKLLLMHGPHGVILISKIVNLWYSARSFYCWAVVMYGSHQSGAKLELRIYYSAQDANPREVISLREAKLKEPNFQHTEPSLVIVGKSSKTKHLFFAESFSDQQQLQRFFRACNGNEIQHGIYPPEPNSPTALLANPPPFTLEDEDMELAMTLSASLQYSVNPDISSTSVFEVGSSSSYPAETASIPSIDSTTLESQPTPAISEGTEDDQMNYASAFFGEYNALNNASPIDMSTTTAADRRPAKTGVATEDVGGTNSSCIICYDAPRE
ncbi:putative E3 ubiquitin-protein ligase XBAT35 [Papaver somniferum]|uniref:putative E3 ubiquitin-protein ligase XBAT35 n=1 Tax=Papaver somniferum TaxID=3469 RepID=UPI000E703014|nr:putative E3 ubiquitin-protein ligase XBAT35 [Papaver somniferum]